MKQNLEQCEVRKYMNLKEKILNFFKKKEKFMENENNRKDDEIPLPNPKPDPVPDTYPQTL